VRQPAQVSNTMVQATAAQNTNKANTVRGSRNMDDSNSESRVKWPVSFAQSGHCHQGALTAATRWNDAGKRHHTRQCQRA
jgi:hypothetical protein